MNKRKTIVCFAGGTSGDIVVAVMDPKNCQYDPQKARMKIAKDRAEMKIPWTFQGDEQKNNFIRKSFQKYETIPSHDVDFHIGQGAKNVLGITCFDKDLRDRSAKRFKAIHTDEDWNSLLKVTKTETVDQYSDDILAISKKLDASFPTIDLVSIINGTLLEKLGALGYKIPDSGISLYDKWIKNQIT